MPTVAFLPEGQRRMEISVRGRITNEKSEGLPGVSVLLKGTTTGTATGTDGTYSITVPDGNGTLIFSFIGYTTEEVPIGNRTTIDISLVPDMESLGEVVVVGYGTQERKDVTGAISTIDVARLRDVPVANASRLIAGQVPGVTVRQANGAPGNEFEVLVRGIGSLGAGSQPLYVVDGFPVGTAIGQNLNPNDIESITVLKDAVSTAIYGARGSNGVVLITTKKAKAGQVSLTATANYGIQNIPDSRKVEVLNGQDFAQFKKDIFVDKIRYFENREPAESEIQPDYRFPEQTQYSTNWYDAILNDNARFQNYNLTLSEGTGNVKTLVSLGLISQEGVVMRTKYDNYSVRANLGGKITNFIQFGLNVNGSYVKHKLAPSTTGWTSLLGSALLMDPRKLVNNPDGSYNSYIIGDGTFGWGNLVQILNETKNNLNIGDLLSNAFLEFSLLKGLKFKSALNVRLNYQTQTQFTPSTVSGIFTPAPQNASLNERSSNTLNYSTDQTLTYTKSFGMHAVDALVGVNGQEETLQTLSASGNTFTSDNTPFLGSASIRDAGSGESSWSILAFFGRVNYSFKDRYLFSGTFRREGSSRFGANTKYGNFPAFSAGWRVSEESFIPKFSWLNDIKLRASWGLTGNSNIGNYSSLAYMDPANYVLGGADVNSLVVSSFANTNLGWEKSRQTDIGLDVFFLNNQLSFTADYYKRITSDMLLPVQIPAISGFTTTFTNIGKVQNTGLEFLLGYRTKVREMDFWSNFNVTFNRNKVLALRGENDELRTGDFYDGYNVSRVGRPIGMLHGYKVVKIFNNQSEIDAAPAQDGAIPGVNQYLDATGDGVISYDTEDMVEIGNPWPKFTWGLTFGGRYKNFDLSVLFTGSQGYDVYRRVETSTMNMDGVFNVLVESKQRWRSEENPGNGKYTTTNTWKWSRESSSRYVYDGSHAWAKNATLGYSIPPLAKSLSLRVFVSADNLLLITNYPGNNPEINNRGGISPGIDDEAYPVARTFTLGANLTF